MTPNIQYIGEHLWPGRIGHILILLSFVGALFSVYSYRKAVKSANNNGSWAGMGKTGFIIHGLSTFSLIGLIFYMMVNHMYEYTYVQQHVSDDLPMRYILSAFWEGQEGSFLLWMFWHIVLGFILIRKAGEWEAPVMIFIGLIQVIMSSMLLGFHIEIGDTIIKLGSNPVALIRDVVAAPIFEKADYLSSITGNGLNPLLQNYWNTIHPPTTFLGFASTVVPFAYAAAGYYTGQPKAWLRPALKWSLFSGGILGVGILMGSAWAYEALSFGGYWAWDPVENMSFVPWLILVAGVHTNLIANSTGRGINSTFIYYTMSFVLTLYSTYLTRSGILGDTSAHAFTEMGLEPQLILMVSLFTILGIILFFKSKSKVPKQEKEESIYSREFWMYVGALVLLFSGVIIASSTSLPVFNKIVSIFNPDYIGKVIQDPIPHYNKFQIWTSIFVMVLSAKAVHLRYRENNWNTKKTVSFAKSHLLYALIAAGLTALFGLWINYFHWKYVLLAFTAFYTITSNFSFLFTAGKRNLKLSASILSHAGFGIMILGIISSGLNETTVTSNPFVMKGILKDEDMASAVTLIKNEPFFVNNYWITYEGDTVENTTRTFDVKFVKQDSLSNRVDSFYVNPNVQYTNDYTKIAATNPDAKHYLDRDIFTSVVSLPKAQQDVKFAKEEEDSLKYERYDLVIGDTLFTKKHYAIVKSKNFDPQHADYKSHDNDIGVGVALEFKSLDSDRSINAEPAIGVREDLLYQYPVQLDELGIKLRLHEATFDNNFTTEEKLQYKFVQLKQGESFDYEGIPLRFTGFEKEIISDIYKPETEDIPIQAILTSNNFSVKPIYIIRNSKPFNIKDYDINTGLHARLTHIDPVKEIFHFQIGRDTRQPEIAVELAEDVPRTDYIVLEALVFPGINLFWAGALTMLLGFFISLLNRRNSKHA